MGGTDGPDKPGTDHVQNGQRHRNRRFGDRQHLGHLGLRPEAAIDQLTREKRLFDIAEIAPGHIFGNLRPDRLIFTHGSNQGFDFANFIRRTDSHQAAIAIDQKIAFGLARVAPHENRHGLAVLFDRIAQIGQAGIVQPVADTVAHINLIGIEIPDAMRIDRIAGGTQRAVAGHDAGRGRGRGRGQIVEHGHALLLAGHFAPPLRPHVRWINAAISSFTAFRLSIARS